MVACDCNTGGTSGNLASCSSAGVCTCAPGYVGDKCDACDTSTYYNVGDADPVSCSRKMHYQLTDTICNPQPLIQPQFFLPPLKFQYVWNMTKLKVHAKN